MMIILLYLLKFAYHIIIYALAINLQQYTCKVSSAWMQPATQRLTLMTLSGSDKLRVNSVDVAEAWTSNYKSLNRPTLLFKKS